MVRGREEVTGETATAIPAPSRPGLKYFSFVDFEFDTRGYTDKGCVATMVIEERYKGEGGKEERVTTRRWYDLLDRETIWVLEQDLIGLNDRDCEATPWYMIGWGMANDMQ